MLFVKKIQENYIKNLENKIIEYENEIETEKEYINKLEIKNKMNVDNKLKYEE